MRATQPYPPTTRPKRTLRRWVWVLGFVVFILGMAGGAYYSLLGESPYGGISRLFVPPFGGKPRVNILVMGVDNVGDRGLADTLMLAVVDVQQREVALLSIPRDSRVAIAGHGPQRINASHVLGGADLTTQTVQKLLGVPIDYSVEIGIKGLVQLVDAMGGIDVDVEKRMRYTDRSQKLYINLYPGPQHLNGEQAMGYVRFRHDATGDLGRIERQQQFLRVVAEHLRSPTNLARIPQLARAFLNTVQTDLNLRDLVALKRLLAELDISRIPMATLPGEPVRVGRAAMLELDADGVQAVVSEVVYGLPPAVEVLNGTRYVGLAAHAKTSLEQAGFRVPTIGDAGYLVERTRILDHRGRPEKAHKIAETLACGRVVRDGTHPDTEVDITVIVGTDYAEKEGRTGPTQARDGGPG